MADAVQLKSELRAAIDDARPDGTYSEETLDRVHALIGQLTPQSPITRPVDAEEEIAGPWLSLFAQFGPRHTAGKPIEHETSFKLLSFGTFPANPLRLLSVEQEIHHATKAYNNVQVVEPLSASLRAHLIVHGRYAVRPELPKRYSVDFYRVTLESADGADEAALRDAFGFAPDQPLAVDLKPPALHSDIVYCDDELRINLGSMGGTYVMERLHHPGRSVRFG
jgi:PAP_fibrillin